MPSPIRVLMFAPVMLALANGQGVILSAKGSGNTGLAFQVDITKSDANIINANELSTNVVNECGRTLLAGNIDIGTVTEAQISNKSITSVTKGSKVAVTIAKIDSNGAGPYSCDLDLTSNGDGTSGRTNLTVKETDSGNTISLDVTMPSDLACIGGKQIPTRL